MEVLLDTHALVWWMVDPSRLSKEAAAALAGNDNRIVVSAVVAWELAIKVNAGQDPALVATFRFGRRLR